MGALTGDQAHRSAAHRPSRRGAIVAAAVRVFARQGFADASIQAIADESGVAPTAVYYHFSGKEELFDAALRRVLDSINTVVATARADDQPGDPEILGHVISAVWHWLEDNPDAGRLVNYHLPGATSRAGSSTTSTRGCTSPERSTTSPYRAHCAPSARRRPGTPARRWPPARSSASRS